MSDSSPWILEADVVYSIRLPRTSLLPDEGASDSLDGPITAYQVDSAPSHPLVQILRVSKSPAGAFDALLFSWSFLPPSTLQQVSRTKKLPRVTRVYCSTIASAVLLRKHYHLPGHLAHFAFTPLRRSPSSLLIHVSLPPSPSPNSPSPPTPFFALIATPFGRTVSLPPLFPSVSVLQPPLPAGEFENPSNSHPHLLRTSTRTLVGGGSQQVKFYPALKLNGRLQFGDGVSFVDCELRGEEKCAKGSVAREVEIWADKGEVLRECSREEEREFKWKAAKL